MKCTLIYTIIYESRYRYDISIFHSENWITGKFLIFERGKQGNPINGNIKCDL